LYEATIIFMKGRNKLSNSASSCFHLSQRRKNLSLIFWPILVVCLLSAGFLLEPTRPVYADASINGATLGTPYDYPSAGGDTWYNTWADNGNIYATADDASAFNGTCNNNITFNELSGNTPSSLTAPYVNCMTSYGPATNTQGCADSYTWKNGGMISVSGTIYDVVACQQDGNGSNANGLQPSEDASIIKSSDHGRHWSNAFGTTNDPNGAEPPLGSNGHPLATFPGSSFSAPFFINYGQDDNPASTADGGDAYVYAASANGVAYDGTAMILGRVRRDQIANLSGADWQYYTGSPGGDGNNSANWSSDVNAAQPVLTNSNHQLSQCAIQYIPTLHRYIFTSFAYPYPAFRPTNQTTLVFFQAPTPWGPWTQFFNQDTQPNGWYDTVPVSKFTSSDGRSTVLFAAGDFFNSSLYHLHAFPLALYSSSQTPPTTIDDTDSGIQYQGRWTAANTSGYYNGTVHYSNTPNDSVSYTFNGTFIQWIGSTNSNHGLATVVIDSSPPTTVDTYSSQWGKQVVLYERTNLNNGQHTITITVTGNHDAASSGTYQDVDAFEFGNTTPPVIGGVDDGTSNYGSNWASATNPNYFNGTLHYSNTAGSTVSYAFNGSFVEWIGATNNDHSYATVTIDNQAPVTVDTYSPQWGYQTVLYMQTGLASGQHTITITMTGNHNNASSNYYQDVDAFVTG
jgi:hypothetical protein